PSAGRPAPVAQGANEDRNGSGSQPDQGGKDALVALLPFRPVRVFSTHRLQRLDKDGNGTFGRTPELHKAERPSQPVEGAGPPGHLLQVGPAPVGLSPADLAECKRRREKRPRVGRIVTP